MKLDDIQQNARDVSAALEPPRWRVFRWVRWRMFQQPENVEIVMLSDFFKDGRA